MSSDGSSLATSEGSEGSIQFGRTASGPHSLYSSALPAEDQVAAAT
eukprot:SAG11_NODE_28864_length_317_cov_0.669725_1_plen_45_part_10